MNRSKLLQLVLPVALLCGASMLTAQTTIVDDTFSDTDRIGGTDGSAASSTSSPVVNAATSSNTQWVINDTNAGKMVASSTGQLWTLKSATNSMAIGYFPQFTIASGETYTFTLDFTTGAAGSTASNLRMALLDGSSTGFRTTDGFGSTDASYVGDVGYGVFSSGSHVGAGDTTNLALNTYQRITTTNDLLNSSSGWGDNTNTAGLALASSSGATGYFEANTAYELKFILSYDGSALLFNTSITGGNLSGLSYTASDAISPTLTFNEFALRFGAGSNQFTSVNLTALSLVSTSAVPEPSTYAIWAALAVFGVVLIRRRSQRAREA